MTSQIRFGVVSESVHDGPAWTAHARRIEAAGVGSLLIRDHFSAGAFDQQLAPFSALATAAAVTSSLRVGTMVLSNDFRHPAVLAHEAASLHHLSGGRFELGLGAGWYEPEYRAAGISYLIAGRGWSGTDVDPVWQMPTIFIGSPAQIAEDLQARRDRFGLSYLVAPDADLPVLERVVAAL